MAEIKIPIRIDGFQCVEEMVQVVLNYTYKGRTLKEWADSISEPQTNADHIRAMTDEQLAELIGDTIDCGSCKDMANHDVCPVNTDNERNCYKYWLDWLKQKVTEE